MKQDIQNNINSLEETHRIHKSVIKTMEDMGYGLLTDGDTFYEKGMELEPRSGITFTMRQAYVIHKSITTHEQQAVERFVKWMYQQDFSYDEAGESHTLELEDMIDLQGYLDKFLEENPSA